MSQAILIPCSKTVNSLELALRNVEAVFLETKSIAMVGNSTGIESDQVDDPPSPIFVLLDPAGTVTMPGKALVCRGSACIGGQKQQVALFRAQSQANGNDE